MDKVDGQTLNVDSVLLKAAGFWYPFTEKDLKYIPVLHGRSALYPIQPLAFERGHGVKINSCSVS